MRALVLSCAVICFGCGPTGGNNGGDANGDGTTGPDACVGLQCQVVNCEAMGMPATTISGTVFAPNGVLPLYGINVYVPNSDPGPMAPGLTCNQCTDALPGEPVGVPQQTAETGQFNLTDMPAGTNIPLVITTGKWRRIITIPMVTACGPNVITAADTSLPKSQDDLTPNTKSVDMPKIAITTGSADSLECLVRRLGIADKEITTSAGAGHVHLYNGNGVSQFDSGFPGGSGQTFTSATTFWASYDNLKLYDMVMLSCEGSQNLLTKPQGALDAMKMYADNGGRVFASHWHNIWIGGVFPIGLGLASPAVWNTIATWSDGADNNLPDGTIDDIDEVNNPKGASFATWMLDPQVMGSTVHDQIAIENGTGRSTCIQVDTTKGERWTYVNGGTANTQNFQFTTPNEQPTTNRCGKVVFSDMHVSGGPASGNYPTSCGTTLTLSPQEKALAFMFFDIASCVTTTIP
jgi:hypothetical protein